MDFSFAVDAVRTFSEETGKRYLVKVPVINLPHDFPLEVNAREQNLRTGVANSIRRSVIEQPDIFHLLNRGIVLTAHSVDFDQASSVLTVTLTDPEFHGVLDGGHTYKIVTGEVANGLHNTARVSLEILTGVDDFKPEIVSARNSSVQVDAASLANVANLFDPIVDWLDTHGIPRERIRAKQFGTEEIPILDILAIMYVFDVDTFGNGMEGFNVAPTRAYSQKGMVLKHFQDAKHIETFTQKMLPLLPDILWLWDYVAIRSQEHYRNGTGRKDGRFGGRRGNAPSASGLYIPNVDTIAVNPAYRFPLIASMRCLVDDSGSQYSWKQVPKTWKIPQDITEMLGRPATPVELFYEQIAPDLIKQLAPEMDSTTPNKIGKSVMLWQSLYTTAWATLQKAQ